jgi:hypothetical protein
MFCIMTRVIGKSSSGRTPGFGPGSRGSSPFFPANSNYTLKRFNDAKSVDDIVWTNALEPEKIITIWA